MADERNFSGVIAPVLTPFDAEGAPDPDRFVEHAEWLLEDGCTALAPFGTTSEANSLGIDERMELLEELAEAGIPAELLMPGTGMCSLADAVVLTEHAMEIGAGGVLMLPPFYYKQPSEEGLFRYYAEVIEEVGDDGLRVYLYHIPQVAGVGIPLGLVDRLVSEFPEIVVGLKDSSGDWANTKAILDAHPGFEVFPGSESFLLDGLRNGAAGCISATANVAAAEIRKVFDGWEGPDADRSQARIGGIRKAIQRHPLIPALKQIVAHYRDDPEWVSVRPPLDAMSDEIGKALVRELEQQHDFRLRIPVVA